MVAAIDGLGAQLQPVERRVGRQGFAFVALQNSILAQRIAFAGKQAMQRIAPQFIMIIEVLVAQYQTINPLANEAVHGVFDEALVSSINKTFGELSQKPAAHFKLAQKYTSPIAREISASKIHHDLTAS